MNCNKQMRLFQLFAAKSDDSITANEHEELQQFLRNDAIARRMWFLHQDIELGLRAQMRTTSDEPACPQPRRQWRPFAATAAGVMIGLFSASLVYAYITPSFKKVMTLLQESFETGSTPLVTGIPIEPGYWSGDYSDVVGEDEELKPKKGKKMLRFMRADFEGKSNLQPSRTSSIWRLVDLRPYRHEFGDGGAVAQLSAVFNAQEFPQGRSYFEFVQIHALDAAMAAALKERDWTELNASSLALARSAAVELDRDPATWQRIDCEHRVPGHADFLLIEIGLKQMPKTNQSAEFAGHYLDDVRLKLARRPLLP
ncbi:MAG: hypothetical protein ABL921_25335 [Pirellula sp.]